MCNPANTAESITEMKQESVEVKRIPGHVYTNPDTGKREVDGKPIRYRVTYFDLRDMKMHDVDFDDIDNGFEHYKWYQKQWYATDCQWDHI